MYSCKVFPPLLVTHRKLKRKEKNKPADARAHTLADVLCTHLLEEKRVQLVKVGDVIYHYSVLLCCLINSE